MAEKDPATASAEAAAKELVRVAYGDLLEPAAKEIGAELGDFVRAIFVAGRGFGYLIRETYEPFVLHALKRVPKEKRIAPQPSLLGKILEGISYETKDSNVWRMSASLLSSAMNADQADDAHPAFVDIIHRLSARELIILKKAAKKQIILTAAPLGNSFINIRYLDADLQHKNLVLDADVLFDNLNSAGLIVFVPQKFAHRPLRDLQDLEDAVQKLRYGAGDCGSFVITLRPFGKSFLAACATDA